MQDHLSTHSLVTCLPFFFVGARARPKSNKPRRKSTGMGCRVPGPATETEIGLVQEGQDKPQQDMAKQAAAPKGTWPSNQLGNRTTCSSWHIHRRSPPRLIKTKWMVALPGAQPSGEKMRNRNNTNTLRQAAQIGSSFLDQDSWLLIRCRRGYDG